MLSIQYWQYWQYWQYYIATYMKATTYIWKLIEFWRRMLQWSTSVKQWRSAGHCQSKKDFSNIYIFWRTKSQTKKVFNHYNVMPSISRITKKQGWQYILGIQQADPPWTGIIMFLKDYRKVESICLVYKIIEKSREYVWTLENNFPQFFVN